MTSEAPQAPPEQITYANLLFYGSWAAIAILVITFGVYVMGVFDSYIPINEVSQYWSMPVSQFRNHFKTNVVARPLVLLSRVS